VVELAWFKYVIEYDLTTQIDILSRFRRAMSDWSPFGERSRGAKEVKRRPLPRSLRIGIPIAVLAVGMMILVLRRRRAGTRARRARLAERAQSALGRALRALARRGIRRAPSETPRALASRAAELRDPGASPL